MVFLCSFFISKGCKRVGETMIKIHKVINNNVVLFIDENGKEVIAMGKGVGFQKKVDDMVDEALVDKFFHLQDEDASGKFQQFADVIPMEYINLADDAIQYAQITLNKKFSESLCISLSDHIYNAVTRFLGGVSLKNPMLWEIRRFYEPEFEVGLHVLEMVNERFKIKLPEDEAAFITIHFVDAELDNSSIENVYLITKVIQDVHNIVRYFFRIEFDEKSIHYYRFITHIRFFAQRLVTKTTYKDDGDDSLFDLLKNKYKNSYKCVLKIDEYIRNNFHYDLSTDEKLYLMVHIERTVYNPSDH